MPLELKERGFDKKNRWKVYEAELPPRQTGAYGFRIAWCPDSDVLEITGNVRSWGGTQVQGLDEFRLLRDSLVEICNLIATQAAPKLAGKALKLSKKWESFVGTGMSLDRNEHYLELRQALDRESFAVIRLWRPTAIREVVEVIDAADFTIAAKRFQKIAKKLKFL